MANIVNGNRIVGMTAEGHRVWHKHDTNTYIVECDYEGQCWERKYSDIVNWVKFFGGYKHICRYEYRDEILCD